MKTIQISLNSIDKVKSFVNEITKYDYDFDLVSGRYVIDAKSIMGIFSLDLSRPIDLNIHAEENVDEVLETLKPYMISDPALKSVLNTNLKTSAEFRFGTCFVFASQCPIYLSLCRTTKLRSSKPLRMHKN